MLYVLFKSNPHSIRIPIAPAAWNSHKISISKEELMKYFIDRGFHPRVAAAQVDREFTAHAPQYVAGREKAGIPRAQEPPRARRAPSPEQEKERYTPPPPSHNERSEREARCREAPPAAAYRSPSTSSYSPPKPPPQTQTQNQTPRPARRRRPPPAAYRSPSPAPESHSKPRHRYSSTSRYRALSPPRYGTYVHPISTPPHTPSPDPEGMRRCLSRREKEMGTGEERKERMMPRAPSPPPAASRDEARRERRRERTV